MSAVAMQCGGKSVGSTFINIAVSRRLRSLLAFAALVLSSLTSALGQSSVFQQVYHRSTLLGLGRNTIWVPILQTGTLINAKPTTINRYRWEDNPRFAEWVNDGTITYTYDSQLRPELIQEDDNRGRPTRKTLYGYHPLTNALLAEVISVFRAGSWHDSVVNEYSYTADGALASEQTTWNSRLGSGPRRRITTYSHTGRPQEIVNQQLQGGSWQKISAERFEYDFYDLETSRILYEFDGLDSAITYGLVTGYELEPDALPDTVFRTLTQWQITNRGLFRVKVDSFVYRTRAYLNPPTEFSTKTFDLSGRVTSHRRFYNLSYLLYNRRNPDASLITNRTEQVWNGGVFVDNSRTSVLDPRTRSTILTERSNGVNFFPFEQISTPVDNAGNPTGVRYQLWDQVSSRWRYDTRRQSMEVGHVYDTTTGWYKLEESVVSFSDSVGFLRPSVLLEYLNYVVDLEPATSAIPSISLYPNPSTNSFRLQGLSEHLHPEQMRVYDLGGHQTTLLQRSAIGDYDVQELPPGVYYVVAGSLKIKLVKQ